MVALLLVAGCGDNTTTNGLCTADDQANGACPGDGGTGGGDAPPPPTCQQLAADHCASIGYGSEPYCLLVFAQDCSSSDMIAVQNYCIQNPMAGYGLNPDGSCRLYWGAIPPRTGCQEAAVQQCTALGHYGDRRCYLTFARTCSSCDLSVSRSYCTMHPEFPHVTDPDGSCRLTWP